MLSKCLASSLMLCILRQCLAKGPRPALNLQPWLHIYSIVCNDSLGPSKAETHVLCPSQYDSCSLQDTTPGMVSALDWVFLMGGVLVLCTSLACTLRCLEQQLSVMPQNETLRLEAPAHLSPTT